MKVRTVIFWPHLIAGALAGTVIVIMSTTGVLLTYERQIIGWSDSHLRSVRPAPTAKRLSIEMLLDEVRRQHPTIAPTSITMSSGPDATAVLATREGNVHLDVYTGRLIGTSATGVRQFMSRVRAWHRWLAVQGETRAVARAITGWSNVLFLFIVVSGAYLWLPRTWTWSHLRNVALFNGKLRGKARDFNWHNVIGVWSVVPLFIIVLSAVPISFQWGNALVYRAVGEQPPAPAARGGGPAVAAREGDERQGGAGLGREKVRGRESGPFGLTREGRPRATTPPRPLPVSTRCGHVPNGRCPTGGPSTCGYRPQHVHP